MPPSNTQVKKILMCMSTPLYAVMACKGTGGWLGLGYHIQKKRKKRDRQSEFYYIKDPLNVSLLIVLYISRV